MAVNAADGKGTCSWTEQPLAEIHTADQNWIALEPARNKQENICQQMA
jgi:hypothetical protein